MVMKGFKNGTYVEMLAEKGEVIMKRYFSCIIFLFFFLTRVAPAQTETSPGSSQKAIAPPPSEMAWVVAVSSADTKARQKTSGGNKTKVFPPTGTLLKEENAVSGDLRKQTKIYSDGSLLRYAKGPMVLYLDPRTKDVVVEDASPEQIGGDLSPTQFSELAWVKPALHTGTKTYEGVACDVYEKLSLAAVQEDGAEVESAPVPEGSPANEIVTAYIDQKTRLPVALVDPVVIRKYKFSPLASPVVLPPEFAGALQRVEAAIEQRRQRYNIPQ